jgi:hypothetical protein
MPLGADSSAEGRDAHGAALPPCPLWSVYGTLRNPGENRVQRLGWHAQRTLRQSERIGEARTAKTSSTALSGEPGDGD